MCRCRCVCKLIVCVGHVTGQAHHNRHFPIIVDHAHQKMQLSALLFKHIPGGPSKPMHDSNLCRVCTVVSTHIHQCLRCLQTLLQGLADRTSLCTAHVYNFFWKHPTCLGHNLSITCPAKTEATPAHFAAFFEGPGRVGWPRCMHRTCGSSVTPADRSGSRGHSNQTSHRPADWKRQHLTGWDSSYQTSHRQACSFRVATLGMLRLLRLDKPQTCRFKAATSGVFKSRKSDKPRTISEWRHFGK